MEAPDGSGRLLFIPPGVNLDEVTIQGMEEVEGDEDMEIFRDGGEIPPEDGVGKGGCSYCCCPV